MAKFEEDVFETAAHGIITFLEILNNFEVF